MGFSPGRGFSDPGAKAQDRSRTFPRINARASTPQASLEEVAAMTNGNGNNSFSWGDALFLHIERPGQPLNIAGVSMFEDEIKLADLRAFVESRLPLIPRYRQRAVPSPFDFGLPTWEFDPQFDIRNHVREVKLKHGTEDELKALAGKIVSESLDRQRPLWDFTLARLKSGRTGMVTRIHHCLADGIAGVGAMNVILDASPIRSAAATVGFHSGASEKWAHRNGDSNSSLPGGRNCRRGRDECHPGCLPEPASGLAEAIEGDTPSGAQGCRSGPAGRAGQVLPLAVQRGTNS